MSITINCKIEVMLKLNHLSKIMLSQFLWKTKVNSSVKFTMRTRTPLWIILISDLGRRGKETEATTGEGKHTESQREGQAGHGEGEAGQDGRG